MTNNDPRNIFVANRNEYADERAGNDSRGDNEQNTKSSYGDSDATNRRGQNEHGQNAVGSGGASGKNNVGNDYDSRVAEMKRLAAKYQREGEGQLVKDIVNNVIEQKAAGKLTDEQLVAFANRIAPLLNAEQKQRLKELVEQLIKL